MECIGRLNLEVDQFESQIETLHAGSKKKKIDKDVCVVGGGWGVGGWGEKEE